ncbi:hypothetical protein TNCV_3174041 [Trichonephila clavipes]|nr:hypothetical protein TNCV_3174041 [Trichonephila clavipes]
MTPQLAPPSPNYHTTPTLERFRSRQILHGGSLEGWPPCTITYERGLVARVMNLNPSATEDPPNGFVKSFENQSFLWGE